MEQRERQGDPLRTDELGASKNVGVFEKPSFFKNLIQSAELVRLFQEQRDRLVQAFERLLLRVSARGNIQFGGMCHEDFTLFDDLTCELNLHTSQSHYECTQTLAPDGIRQAHSIAVRILSLI